MQLSSSCFRVEGNKCNINIIKPGTAQACGVCMGSSYRCIVACADIGNGTGHRTAIMAIQLLLTSGLVRHEAVLHNGGTSPARGGGGGCVHRLVTVCTHGDFIMLPYWDIRLLAP